MGLPKVEIRRNADGVIHSYIDDQPWGENDDFLWGEGNFCCDCNRGLLFARAVGEEDPDRECGDTEYSVRITDGDTVLYEDDDWAKP